MRRVIMLNRVSVDGYFAGPHGEIDWFVRDPEVDKAVHKGAVAGTALFGRTTYELFESVWPKIEADPKAPKEAQETAKGLTQMTKIVFSKTMNSVTWKNSVLQKGHLTDEVRRLKQEDGSDIIIFGSGTIIQQLTTERLIDEYVFVVTPIILGAGKLLFPGVKKLNLNLSETKYFASGNVLLRYKLDNEDNGFVARASISIAAPVEKVWDALTNPETIKQYMFGTTVTSEWIEGSPIIWKGEWEGKKYEDKGSILKLEPEHLIKYNHFSPLSGKPDRLENYHNVTIELRPDGASTLVSLSQDNNESDEEKQHSEKNWENMLKELKGLLEK